MFLSGPFALATLVASLRTPRLAAIAALNGVIVFLYVFAVILLVSPNPVENIR